MQEKIGYPDNILNDTYLTQENKGVSGTSSTQFNVSICTIHAALLPQVTVFEGKFFETVLSTLSSNARHVLQRLRKPFDRNEFVCAALSCSFRRRSTSTVSKGRPISSNTSLITSEALSGA